MNSSMKGLACLIVASALSTQCGQALAASAQPGLIFAKTNCAMCHAIGKYDESPLPVAPPLRTLHELYPVDALEEAFAEGIVTGHPSMPQFQLDGAQINDLITYLKTLE
jgi:cytochrome c